MVVVTSMSLTRAKKKSIYTTSLRKLEPWAANHGRVKLLSCMADGKRGPYHGQYKQEHYVLENNAAELYCLGQICSVIPSQAHREVRWAPGWPSGSLAVLAVTRWLPDPGAAPYPWWDMKACEQIPDPSQQALSPVTSRGRSIPISCFSVPTQHTEGTKVQRAMQGSSVPNERGFRWGLLG